MQVDRCVVISLCRRPERLDAFRARMPAAWPFPEVEPWEAIDGTLCPKPDWFAGSPGAWGCYQSHNRIVEECLNAGVESVAIFEDDCSFVPDFAGELAAFEASLPGDWGQVYLGGQHLQSAQPVSERVVKPGNINRTHAYVVRGRAALAEIYRWQHAGHHWRGRHHVDHHYGRLQKTGRIPVYAPARWLCGQAENHSDIANKPFAERWFQKGATR